MKRFLIVFYLLCALPVYAQEARGTLQFSGAVIDPEGAQFNPMAPKNQADARYPATAVTCHYRYNMCFTPNGRYLGTIEQAKHYLPQIDPTPGIQAGTVVCNTICYDYLGQVVGRPKAP